MDFRSLSAHQRCQFVVDDFNHELARLHAREHILSECFLLDSVRETLGHFIVDVGIEQGAAHVLKGFGHIDFRDASFAL